MPLWYRITTLDGREISRTHSLGDGKWRWITDTVKGNAECNYEDIDIEESDDGDFITVKGKRYARVQPLEDFSESEENKQAIKLAAKPSMALRIPGYSPSAWSRIAPCQKLTSPGGT